MTTSTQAADLALADKAIAQALRSPCTSFWLSAAIDALLDRDPVDAASDAAQLFALFEARVKALLGE